MGALVRRYLACLRWPAMPPTDANQYWEVHADSTHDIYSIHETH
jgi:hypothetical protein